MEKRIVFNYRSFIRGITVRLSSNNNKLDINSGRCQHERQCDVPLTFRFSRTSMLSVFAGSQSLKLWYYPTEAQYRSYQSQYCSRRSTGKYSIYYILKYSVAQSFDVHMNVGGAWLMPLLHTFAYPARSQHWTY